MVCGELDCVFAVGEGHEADFAIEGGLTALEEEGGLGAGGTVCDGGVSQCWFGDEERITPFHRPEDFPVAVVVWRLGDLLV